MRSFYGDSTDSRGAACSLSMETQQTLEEQLAVFLNSLARAPLESLESVALFTPESLGESLLRALSLILVEPMADTSEVSLQPEFVETTGAAPNVAKFCSER